MFNSNSKSTENYRFTENNKEKENSKKRLSLFEQRLQSLSDSFYSTILDESLSLKTKQIVRKADDFSESKLQDFTFDQCSVNDLSGRDQFSFTFHSVEQTNQTKQMSSNFDKNVNKRLMHSSTPNPVAQQRESSIHMNRNDSVRKPEDQTVLVPNQYQPQPQPQIIGYYPVVTYQPVHMPAPMILFKDASNAH